MELSINDNTIMWAICQYPDLKFQEKEEMITKIKNPHAQKVAKALAGLIPLNELSEQERIDLIDWETRRNRKQNRIRNEQIQTRYNNESPTNLARKLLSMRDKGQITDETLILYGISGDLPVRTTYNQMTSKEKRQIWENRMKNRYGVTWREYFNTIPSIFEDDVREEIINEWMKEGF